MAAAAGLEAAVAAAVGLPGAGGPGEAVGSAARVGAAEALAPVAGVAVAGGGAAVDRRAPAAADCRLAGGVEAAGAAEAVLLLAEVVELRAPGEAGIDRGCPPPRPWVSVPRVVVAE